MGTDIHSFIERWVPDTGWQWLKGDLFDNTTTYSDGTVLADGEPWEPITGRCYHLFGFLAGVRDGGVRQIHARRGLPWDLSPELRTEFGPSPDDYHSHSWATGAELIAFDYTKPMRADAESIGGVTVYEGGTTTVGEYIGLDYVQRFHEIAALAENPAHVRMVYAFDS